MSSEKKNISLPAESEKNISQGRWGRRHSSLWSQASTDLFLLNRHSHQPEEHYWDITSMSSMNSSRSSALVDQRRRRNEQYWEGTNMELTVPVTSERRDEHLSASPPLPNKSHMQQKEKQYWEGYNEEPLVLQRQEQSRRLKYSKPYWA